MGAQGVLFALLRAVVCGVRLDDTVTDACSTEMLWAVYRLAKEHDLAHLAGHILGDLNLPESEPLTALKKNAMYAAYRYARQDWEYRRVCGVLEQARIPFIPLKGAVIRKLYPEAWMRTSCDIDILVKEEQLEQAETALKNALDYKSQGRGDHDIGMRAPSGVLLELHYDTVQQRYADDARRRILGQVWKLSTPLADGKYEHRMPDELFFFYHIAHMAKHFENGGCGIKPILDIWVLNHKTENNRDKRNALLSQGGLLVFAQTMEKLSEVWFHGGTSEPLVDQVGEYILRGGVYGNQENRAAYGQAKSGGKLKYLITRRVFMPYDYLKAEYPILKDHKWLAPFYQPIRWVRMLRSGRAGVHFHEVLANTATNGDTRQSTRQMLRQLGL